MMVQCGPWQHYGSWSFSQKKSTLDNNLCGQARKISVMPYQNIESGAVVSMIIEPFWLIGRNSLYLSSDNIKMANGIERLSDEDIPAPRSRIAMIGDF